MHDIALEWAFRGFFHFKRNQAIQSMLLVGLVVHLVIYRLLQRMTLSDYCQDVIYDIVWEWDVDPINTSGDISLTPICPSCAYELFHSQHPQYIDTVMVTCESCHWTTDMQGVWNNITADIIRVIDQRTRNNDWKNAKKRLKALKKKKQTLVQ